MKWINLPLLFLFVFSAFVLSSCGSEPEIEEEDPVENQITEEPEQDPQDPPEQDPGAGMDQAEDLTDLIAEAEGILVKASEVGAGDYFPEDFSKASADLEDAIAMEESDWEAAKALLEAVVESGQTLYDDSFDILAQQYRDNLDKLDERLLILQAQLYIPEGYQKTNAMKQDLENILLSDDIPAAYEQYRKTYYYMDSLIDALSNDISWIEILIRDTETYLAEAEEAEAFIYAEEEMSLANQYYLDGLRLFSEYNLADSEHELLYAKYYARKAALAGNYNRKVTETDDLMYEVMAAIEEASKLTVVDGDGNIVNPAPWDADEALTENPLTDLEVEVEDDETIPDSNLKADEVDENEEEEVIIDGTEDAVKGDSEDEDYLETAKEMWTLGVQARNAGELDIAEQYFIQANVFVEAYESNAVTQVYTVQWREVDTDCLWRIAGYDSIYGNPFLWPKIWRRNKKIIQYPDLIFPGQVLVIPPQ